jgi:hypothetical protein
VLVLANLNLVFGGIGLLHLFLFADAFAYALADAALGDGGALLDVGVVVVLDLRGDCAITEDVGVMVEHPPRAVEVHDHVDFVTGLEVLNEDLGKFGATVGDDIAVSEGVEALPQHQQTLVDLDGLLEVGVITDLFVAGQVADRHVQSFPLHHEDGVRARTGLVDGGLASAPLPDEPAQYFFGVVPVYHFELAILDAFGILPL